MGRVIGRGFSSCNSFRKGNSFPVMISRLVTRALLFATSIACGAAPSTNRPNFLFIYTDDQRYDALSVVQREQGERGRFAWLQTPHLDRIASEGVRFRNAF